MVEVGAANGREANEFAVSKGGAWVVPRGEFPSFGPCICFRASVVFCCHRSLDSNFVWSTRFPVPWIAFVWTAASKRRSHTALPLPRLAHQRNAFPLFATASIDEARRSMRGRCVCHQPSKQHSATQQLLALRAKPANACTHALFNRCSSCCSTWHTARRFFRGRLGRAVRIVGSGSVMLCYRTACESAPLRVKRRRQADVVGRCSADVLSLLLAFSLWAMQSFC